MTTPELNQEEQLFLESTPADGRSMGNLALNKQLGWDTDKYFAVQKKLVEKGLLKLGHGRGGSVSRVLGEANETVELYS